MSETTTRIDAILSAAADESRDLTRDEQRELGGLFTDAALANRENPELRARLDDAFETIDRATRYGKPSKSQEREARDATREAEALLRATGYGIWIDGAVRGGYPTDQALATARHHYEADRHSEANAEARAKLPPPTRDTSNPMYDFDPGQPVPENRLGDLLFGAEFRSTLTTSGGSAFTTYQTADVIWPTLAANSVFLSMGPQHFTTDSTIFRIPGGTAFATATWRVTEGTAIAESDAGYQLTSVQPDVITTYSAFSQEAVEDDPQLLDFAAAEMLRQFGRSLDAAVFDAGNGAHISALHGNATAGTASAGGTLTSFDPFVAAAGSAIANGVSYGNLAYVIEPLTWGALGTAHISSDGTADNRPLLSANVNLGGAAIAGQLLGRPLYVSDQLTVTGGTAYALCFDPGQVAVVTRRDFSTLVDPVTLAEQGLVRLIGRWRIGVAALNSGAVAEIGGIVP